MGSVVGIIREETPAYDVLKPLTHGAELRKYAPQVRALVEYTQPAGVRSTREPFMLLAGYIGVLSAPQNVKQAAAAGAPSAAEPIAMTAPVVMGNAAAAEPIAMTAPVVMGAAGAADDQKFMSFILPASKYARAKDAPVPTNARVKIVDEPARTVAVLRFSGGLTPSLVDAKGAALLDAVTAAGLAPALRDAKPWHVGGFNPPWTPGFLATNEVYIPIAEPGEPAAADVDARRAPCA
jgi:hypothetical protein